MGFCTFHHHIPQDTFNRNPTYATKKRHQQKCLEFLSHSRTDRANTKKCTPSKKNESQLYLVLYCSSIQVYNPSVLEISCASSPTWFLWLHSLHTQHEWSLSYHLYYSGWDLHYTHPPPLNAWTFSCCLHLITISNCKNIEKR